MGVPRFAPADVPFLGEGDAAVRPLEVDGATVEVTVLSIV